ncbi:hypothetical protein ILYODFUR_019446 [Ilyodon furcidens]|uniref:Uncharacterized protein n=1 Tax=Ilyodon furcidens TaxID=33524 RepID=A0ABV0UWA2_9TELE
MFPACFGFPALNILQIDAQSLRSLTGAAPVCQASVFQVLDVQWGGAQRMMKLLLKARRGREMQTTKVMTMMTNRGNTWRRPYLLTLPPAGRGL